jgi:hypothetical protein
MRNGTPTLANIQQRAVSLISSSMSENTRMSYTTALNHFSNFHEIYGFPLEWPVSTYRLVMYIAYCYEKNLAASTILLYTSGIGFAHKLKGFQNPSENFVIRKMLEGCKRSRHSTDMRVPISICMLNKLAESLKHVCFSNFERILFTSAFYLAYFGLFRVSELVASSSTSVDRALQKEDVIFSKDNRYVTIRLRISKTNQAGKPTFIVIPINGETSSGISFLKQLVILSPSKSRQFFCHLNGCPLTRYQFSSVLAKACRHAGFQSKVLTHSFRIGRATDLALKGISDDQIKMLGRWSSNSFSRYIRM